MTISVPEALSDNVEFAATKARAAQDLPRYIWSSILAGAYVGVAIVLLVAVSSPLVETGSPAAKLVQGGVFGIALTLVVFAGADLFTGNAMVMLQGWWHRSVRPSQVVTVWSLSLVGNVIGSVMLAAAVYAGGTITGSSSTMLASMTAAKDAASGPQLFWRAVLCNALVCLALWMAARTRSDAAKLGVLWWALLAFICSGFEHSIANVTSFSLAALDGSIGWGALARNLVWTVPGNIVGGGVVIGLGYAWMSGQRAEVAAPADVTLVEPAGALSAEPALVG